MGLIFLYLDFERKVGVVLIFERFSRNIDRESKKALRKGERVPDQKIKVKSISKNHHLSLKMPRPLS